MNLSQLVELFGLGLLRILCGEAWELLATRGDESPEAMMDRPHGSWPPNGGRHLHNLASASAG